jgi:hypothetical protein
VPEAFHYRRPDRTGDVFVLAEAPLRLGGGSLMLDLRYALADLFGRTTGAHGYDPARTSDMNGIFLAIGRGAPAGRRIAPVLALDVAPTAARLLGVEPPRHCEGTAIEGIAAEPPAAPIAPPAPRPAE